MRHRFFWILCLAATLATPLDAMADPPSPEDVLARARGYLAIAEYDAAANGLETFARQAPKASDAPQALEDAIVLRLGLGQTDQANEDASLFVRNYGTTLAVRTARVRFAVAEYSVEHEDYASAKKQLAAWASAFDGRSPLELGIQVHGFLGRVYLQLNDAKNAEVEYAKVVSLWRAPHTLDAIKAEGGDLRSVARALTATGEALFFFAEKKRRVADAIHIPAYHGGATEKEIVEYIKTKVEPWLKKRWVANEEAERAYLWVLDLQPAAPPRWVIASANQVGQLWGNGETEIGAIPTPAAWRTDKAIRDAYAATTDAAFAPWKKRAREAFQKCIQYSVKYQYFDDYARACSDWLTKNERDRYHPVVEILPRPILSGAAVLRVRMSDPLPDPR